MRGFRLVRYVGGLAAITRTLWLSLPSMFSIVTLIAITTFIYASVCPAESQSWCTCPAAAHSQHLCCARSLLAAAGRGLGCAKWHKHMHWLSSGLCAGIGTQLFPTVKWGSALTRQINFTSFTRSFLFLLQTMTGTLASMHAREVAAGCLVCCSCAASPPSPTTAGRLVQRLSACHTAHTIARSRHALKAA